MQGGWEVKVDLKSNRLYITLAGTIRKTEAEKIYTEVRFGAQDLQKGFTVITDFRKCRVGHLAGVPVFMKIMEYLTMCGVGKTIRVVGKSNVLIKQITRVTSRVKDYSPIYVSSLEEVEEVLSSPDEEDKS